MHAVEVGDKLIPSQNPSGSGFVDVKVNSEDDIQVCFDDRMNVLLGIDVENLGTDSIRNLQLGWYLASDQLGQTNWSGTIAPNSSMEIPLSSLSFNFSGVYNVVIWAHQSGTDVNSLNDTAVITIVIDPPFIFDELHDTVVCANQFLPLSLSSGINSYSWNDGSVGNHNVIYEPGQYVVTVTDADGCMAIDSMTVTQFLAPAALLPGDTVICEGQIILPLVTQNFVSYQWNGGDTVPNVTISEEGVYILNVQDVHGCNYTDSLQVSIQPSPTPALPSQVSFCEGDSTLLAVANTYNSYQWSNGASGSMISTTVPGTYYVTVTGISGCLGFDTIDVLMNPLPNVDFPNSQMCNNEPIVIDIGWYADINWSNGDSVQNPLITQPGVYVVTVSDLNDCSSMDSVTVINNNVSVSLGPDKILCQNQSHYIFLNGYDTYLWDDGGTSATHFLGAGGIYSVTVSTNGCSASDEIEVIEIENPISDFDMNLDLVNKVVDFTNLSDNFTNVSWDFNDGTSSSLVSPVHTYANYGLYQVTLTVSNECDTSTIVQNLGLFPLDNLGLVKQEELSIYPTLAQDMVYLKLGNAKWNEVRYVVYDVSGKVLLNKTLINPKSDQAYQVDVSRFASGSYFMKVISSDELLGVQQFLKQ